MHQHVYVYSEPIRHARLGSVYSEMLFTIIYYNSIIIYVFARRKKAVQQQIVTTWITEKFNGQPKSFNSNGMTCNVWQPQPHNGKMAYSEVAKP